LQVTLSLPAPQTSVLIAVPEAMAMLLTMLTVLPFGARVVPALLKVPGLRLIVELLLKPLTFSVLLLPPSHSVTTGLVLTVKSKKFRIELSILLLKPNIWPPESGELMGLP